MTDPAEQTVPAPAAPTPVAEGEWVWVLPRRRRFWIAELLAWPELPLLAWTIVMLLAAGAAIALTGWLRVAPLVAGALVPLVWRVRFEHLNAGQDVLFFRKLQSATAGDVYRLLGQYNVFGAYRKRVGYLHPQREAWRLALKLPDGSRANAASYHDLQTHLEALLGKAVRMVLVDKRGYAFAS